MGKNVETRIVCPKCGTSFAIPAEEFITAGMVIGKNSNLGTIYLQPEEDGCGGHIAHFTLGNGMRVKDACSAASAEKGGGVTATGMTRGMQSRLDALRARGIDVSKYHSIPNGDGTEALIKMEDGIPSQVTDGELEALEKTIYANGYIRNSSLHRRWIMAQMFYLLRGGWRDDGDYNRVFAWYDSDYSFRMLRNELNAQAHMEGIDSDCFRKRNRWFHRQLVLSMIDHDIKQFCMYWEKLPAITRGRHRGLKHFLSGYVSQTGHEKLIDSLTAQYFSVSRTHSARELLAAVDGYLRLRPSHTRRQIGRSTEWVSAYKGAGAYYTLDNLIKFHGCHVMSETGQPLSMEQSLRVLESKAAEYASEGWRLFAFMKKVISDNGFDYEQRMRELGVRR